MKELEKTKRISIAAVVTILVVLIAIVTYKRPSHLYAVNTNEAIEMVSNTDYIISLQELESFEYNLVDVRSDFEFNKGHMENAINIYAPEILSEENTEIFKDIRENKKAIVLYGATPNEAIAPLMVLQQIGYANIKLLAVDLSYLQNKLMVKPSVLEVNKFDTKKFIAESIKKAEAKPKPKPKPKPIVKKVTPKKKKKKMPVEGGC